MVSLFSTMASNDILENIENRAFNNLSFIALLYKRYVDGTFVVVAKDKILKCINTFKSAKAFLHFMNKMKWLEVQEQAFRKIKITSQMNSYVLALIESLIEEKIHEIYNSPSKKKG